MHTSPGLTRRTTLAGIGAGVVAMIAGCRATTSSTVPLAQALRDDPLGPIYTETIALIRAYDAALGTYPLMGPLLGPLREEHRRHAIAIAALMRMAAPAIGPGPDATPASPSAVPSASTGPPAGTPSPGTGDPAIAARGALGATEKIAQLNAANACIDAPADRVTVLASIAACRATHVAALR